MSRDTITRVQIWYENGNTKYVQGQDAKKWQKAVESQGSLAYVHGYVFPDLEWREEDGEEGDQVRRRETEVGPSGSEGDPGDSEDSDVRCEEI